jgi:DNA polymerase III delta subunit
MLKCLWSITEVDLLYILWGEDEFSLEEKLLEIKKNLGDVSLLPTNTNILDGQKLSLRELEAIGGAMPFLSAKRLVIIKGLLGRFESRGSLRDRRRAKVAPPNRMNLKCWQNVLGPFRKAR